VTEECFVDDRGNLVTLAARVVNANREAGRMVALAESCTGGLVCAAITDVAGSSDILSAGLVTYSNAAKTSLLGVSDDILATFGAVSPACAWAMAQGALVRTGADVAVSITGIAGPGGGSEEKPVGMVVFSRKLRGQSDEDVYTVTRHFDPSGGRDGIRRQAALFALELLLPESDCLTGCA
jgi:nicotinamide-nucleotide amidase